MKRKRFTEEQIAFALRQVEVEQEPANPLNGLIGFGYEFNERWNVALEYGFNFDDITLLALTGTFRF